MTTERRLLLRAAALIDATARELRRSHTVDRKWPEGEIEARLDYEDMKSIVRELRRMAG